MIFCAVAGPTPSRMSSSSSDAVLMFTSAPGAVADPPAADADPLAAELAAAGGAASSAASGSASAAGGSATAPVAPVNINTASLEELDTLDGVGPATAQKIIDSRLASAPFKVVDDIKNVSGIGDAKFAAMKDSITV